MKTEITTLDELSVFSTLMKELLVELPLNVKITVHLKKDDYNKIVPEEKIKKQPRGNRGGAAHLKRHNWKASGTLSS